VGVLGDVADHPRRGVVPESIEPDMPYIALEHMPKRCIALYDWGVADGLESNKFEFKEGEILFGKLRPYFHKVGVAPVDGVCSTDIVVVAPKSEVWFGVVLGHVSSVEFVQYANAGSTGTKMPRTSWAEMARYALALPPLAVVTLSPLLVQGL
jgi:type I restriction enzyme, S subunit